MGENIVRPEDVMGQNALFAAPYIPIEKRNLYAKNSELLTS